MDSYFGCLFKLPALRFILLSAQLVELADTLGLEPSAARHGGSTPSLGTIFISNSNLFKFLDFQSNLILFI
jgi:hypothetical protein